MATRKPRTPRKTTEVAGKSADQVIVDELPVQQDKKERKPSEKYHQFTIVHS